MTNVHMGARRRLIKAHQKRSLMLPFNRGLCQSLYADYVTRVAHALLVVMQPHAVMLCMCLATYLLPVASCQLPTN